MNMNKLISPRQETCAVRLKDDAKYFTFHPNFSIEKKVFEKKSHRGTTIKYKL